MAFVAALFWENLTAGTAKNYLAAVRYNHIALGLGHPNIGGMVQLEYIVKGMKRLASPHS